MLYLLIAGLAVSAPLLFFALRQFEKTVVFHPEPYAPGPAWRLPERSEDVWIETADSVRLHGWFISSAVRPALATIIYFHGNGGNLSNVGWIGESLAARGFDCLLMDYRGYGRSTGEVSGELDIYADADAAYEYIVNKRGVRPKQLVLYGQSLGTTAATHLASHNPCGALILESGLSSASDMAAAIFPWSPRWLHILGKNRFESARKLQDVSCPVLITHGEPDQTIPTAQGRALYRAAREPKRLLIIPGAGHNVPGFGGDRYLDQIAEFIRTAMND